MYAYPCVHIHITSFLQSYCMCSKCKHMLPPSTNPLSRKNLKQLEVFHSFLKNSLFVCFYDCAIKQVNAETNIVNTIYLPPRFN